jgi:peptide deformylase
MDAKCVQHEIDHLDGICFTTRVSRLKLDLARKRQRKLLNGRAK